MPQVEDQQVVELADADRLRRSGLRVTAARLAVLAVLRSGGHQGVEAVGGAVKERLGTMSTQGVYDVLRVLTQSGLLRRIEPAGSAALFEYRTGDNHHHLVCRTCLAVADVDCAVGQAPCLRPSSRSEYLVDEADVTYWGLCPSCQEASADRGTGALGSNR